ncbi:hypothetical protein LXL04_003241 [Taraxacum kok-saghyz]
MGQEDGHILHITEYMVAGEEIIDNKLPQYKRNNLSACLNIPSRKRGMGYEELVKFILGHPLSTAFTEGTYVIPQVLLEFWYTCRVEGSAGDIFIGTVNDGENTVRITLENLRKILRLPILPKYDLEVSKSQARSVLLEIGFPTAVGVIEKSQFTTKWGFLVSTIVRSQGTKIGSLGSVNEVEMQLLYALVKGRNLDFAQVFFNELKNHVCKKPRDPAAPYSRFVSMCIQDSIGKSEIRKSERAFVSLPQRSISFRTLVRYSFLPCSFFRRFAPTTVLNDRQPICSYKACSFFLNDRQPICSLSFRFAPSSSELLLSFPICSFLYDTPKLDYKMFNGNIQDDEVEMPSTMRFWISNPFQPASSSSEATDPASGSSESMNEHNPTLPPPPATSVAAPYYTSLHSLDILAQAANVTSRNQGMISSSQQSPIPAQVTTDISELTREVRDLASSFQSYKKVQDNRYADMQNEMLRMRSVQESLQKPVQDLKDHNPRTSELDKSIKIIKDNSVSIDMTKNDDNDKKGESTKRRRESDEEGETGYKRYKRRKWKIIDEETQPQPPEQLSQADAANLQLVQIQPPETISLETPQIGKNQLLQDSMADNLFEMWVSSSKPDAGSSPPTWIRLVNQGIENKAIKNKYPLMPYIDWNDDVKLQHLHYLINLLLPFVKQIREEQEEEISKSSVKIERLEDTGERIICDRCLISIFGLHQYCSRCKYETCLTCSKEIRSNCRKNRRTSTSQSGPNMVAENNGSLFCVSKCGRTLMHLRDILEETWISNLETRAEKINNKSKINLPPDNKHDSLFPETSSDYHIRAANREGSNDNYLYCRLSKDAEDDLILFRNHLSKGEPLVIKDVLDQTHGISWEPMVMSRALCEHVNPEVRSEMSELQVID